LWTVFGVLCLLSHDALVLAQFQMPDPKEMSGIPRPDGQMTNASVSVRLIRGDLSNNITGHPVELRVGDSVRTGRTDDAGRAEFNGLTAGSVARAVAVVEGERLESQEFTVPVQGGVRLLLVATDREKERQKAADALLPPVTGQVVIGGDSRIVIEPNDETLAVFYILDIVNTARAPVNPQTPFAFDAPAGATSTSVLQGSSPLATNAGNRVQVAGPFPSGTTNVRLGIEIPVTGGTLDFSQVFPATLDSLVVIVRKNGDLKLSSAQIQRQQDTDLQGTPVIVGAGGTIPAGQPISISLSGLAHHSRTPRRIALTLAVVVVATGVWAARRRTDEGSAPGAERKRLIARRERLFQDLVRLEQDFQRGKIDSRRHSTRREELIGSLEHIYGALDTDDSLPATGRA
jgi:hypothetical protein